MKARQTSHKNATTKLTCTHSAGSRYLNPSRGGRLQAVTKRRKTFCWSGVKPSRACMQGNARMGYSGATGLHIPAQNSAPPLACLHAATIHLSRQASRPVSREGRCPSGLQGVSDSRLEVTQMGDACRAYIPELLDDRVVLMVPASVVDVPLHVCDVQALVVPASYQCLRCSPPIQ